MRGFKLLGLSLLTIVSLMAAACAADDSSPTATSTPTPRADLTSDDGPAGPTDTDGAIEAFSTADGNFAVLISDEENAIGDFTHLWVEIDRVGVFSLDTDAWIEIDVPEDTQAVDPSSSPETTLPRSSKRRFRTASTDRSSCISRTWGANWSRAAPSP